MYVENSGEVMGCFPLIHVKGALIDDQLMSLPFTDYGCGPYVKDNCVEVLSLMINESKRLAKALNAYIITINSPQQHIINTLYNAGFKKIYDYNGFFLDLSKPIDLIWKNFEKRIRNTIRKAEKENIKIIEDNNHIYTNNIYRLHLENMKALGTPPHAKTFFSEIDKNLNKKGLVKSIVATYNEKVIAAISIYPHRKNVRWGLGVQSSKHRTKNPLSLLLWHALKWSKTNGYSEFDFGGSRPESNNYFFKRGWIHKNQKNGEIRDLTHLSFFMDDSRNEIPDIRSTKYNLMSKTWKLLMPGGVAKYIGPYIRKQLAK